MKSLIRSQWRLASTVNYSCFLSRRLRLNKICFFFWSIARQKGAAGPKVVQCLVAASDCDDLSLVSYNSVRDCNLSAAPKTAPTSVHHQLGLLSKSTGEGLKVCRKTSGTTINSIGIIINNIDSIFFAIFT